MPIRSPLEPTHAQTGCFRVDWEPLNAGGERLVISVEKRVLWQSVPGEAFIAVARGRADVAESRGFFTIDDNRSPYTEVQTLEQLESKDDQVLLSGRVDGAVQTTWQMVLRALDTEQLHMEIRIGPDLGNSARILLRHASEPDERFFGFGEQFTHLNLKGRTLDILSQEPGIGRGVQPLTWFMNTFFGAGGDDTRSNAPVPHYITSHCQSLCLENHELSRFDLRATDRVEIELWSDVLRARVFRGESPAQLVEAYTRFSGRMPPLPDWIQQGAVIGMQGGTEAVRERARKLADAGAPVAAYWLQDWVGARKTSVGSQLWWNWELDPNRYPGWNTLRDDLAAEGIRLMSYVNPFLVDTSEREGGCRRNLFQEATERGFLVRRADGSPYLVQNTSFSAAMVDLTHPQARDWLKKVLREQVLGAGVSGWMADFGEALPFDAVLHDGSDPASFHNAYPEAWAKLNREAIQEAGMEGEAIFFARSGFSRSPGQSTLFWLGDQLTSWRTEDGIRSAVTGLLSSGFSGFSQNHSDIGGYTTTAIPGCPFPIPFLDYRRTPELLHRWIELNAFTSVFRTHEGNQPERNWQIDGDAQTLSHFARFARLYAALGGLRARLGREAADQGLPVVRHPWLCFPEDPETTRLAWQFMLGDTFMVAPVLDPGSCKVSIYLPAGHWRHLWSDHVIDHTTGGWYQVDAPIGAPAVFFPQNNPDGEALVEALDARGDRTQWLGRQMIGSLETKR